MCRGLLHFDFVSSIGVPKAAGRLADAQLAPLLLQRCRIDLPAAGDDSSSSSRAGSLGTPEHMALHGGRASAGVTAADAAPLSAAAAIRKQLAAGVPGLAASAPATTLIDDERTGKLMDLRILAPELVLTAAQVRCSSWQSMEATAVRLTPCRLPTVA